MPSKIHLRLLLTFFLFQTSAFSATELNSCAVGVLGYGDLVWDSRNLHAFSPAVLAYRELSAPIHARLLQLKKEFAVKGDRFRSLQESEYACVVSDQKSLALSPLNGTSEGVARAVINLARQESFPEAGVTSNPITKVEIWRVLHRPITGQDISQMILFPIPTDLYGVPVQVGIVSTAVEGETAQVVSVDPHLRAWLHERLTAHERELWASMSHPSQLARREAIQNIIDRITVPPQGEISFQTNPDSRVRWVDAFDKLPFLSPADSKYVQQIKAWDALEPSERRYVSPPRIGDFVVYGDIQDPSAVGLYAGPDQVIACLPEVDACYQHHLWNVPVRFGTKVSYIAAPRAGRQP